MNRYPSAKSIMKNLTTPYPKEVKLIDEFLKGNKEYPKKAEKLGKATDQLAYLADFVKYFLEKRDMQTRVLFGDETIGNAYLHNQDQIHLQKPSLLAGMHEVGHAMYGKSELKACTYSTSLLLKSKEMKNQIPIFLDHKLINLENRI